MREKLKDYADKICMMADLTDIINDLKLTFCEAGLFHEEGACLEKLYHITHEPELFMEIGNIFQYKVRNKEIANIAYNKYLFYTQPEFYKNYAKNISSMGYTHIEENEEEDNTPPEIIDLCDRFDLIVFMMIYLKQNREFDTIIQLSQNLFEIKNKILNFKPCSEATDSSLKEIENSEMHLSEILSEIKNRNDINSLAIILNPDNKRAYINILDDNITYKKYQNTILFYNNEYCKKFNITPSNSISQICWHISDFFRDNYEFYDAVRFQKYALEYDLNITGEKSNA